MSTLLISMAAIRQAVWPSLRGRRVRGAAPRPYVVAVPYTPQADAVRPLVAPVRPYLIAHEARVRAADERAMADLLSLALKNGAAA